MTPAWTILIATLGQRGDRLRQLLDVLLPQVDTENGLVNVMALWNNGERSLCHVRQDLVSDAPGAYVSFIDDDDLVPSYYVRQVVPLLFEGVDYVGWRMQAWWDNVKLKPTYHSLRYDHWSEDDAGYYRDVSHLNPIRRSLALRASFCAGEPPEDVGWADRVRSFVKTERYIDDVMYYYRFNTSDSTWHPGSVSSDVQHERIEVTSPNFSWHTWSPGAGS